MAGGQGRAAARDLGTSRSCGVTGRVGAPPPWFVQLLPLSGGGWPGRAARCGWRRTLGVLPGRAVPGRGLAAAGLPGSPGPVVRRGMLSWRPRGRSVRRKRSGGTGDGAAPSLAFPRSSSRAVAAAPRSSLDREAPSPHSPALVVEVLRSPSGVGARGSGTGP